MMSTWPTRSVRAPPRRPPARARLLQRRCDPAHKSVLGTDSSQMRSDALKNNNYGSAVISRVDKVTGEWAWHTVEGVACLPALAVDCIIR